jgi:hypothetical protein
MEGGLLVGLGLAPVSCVLAAGVAWAVQAASGAAAHDVLNSEVDNFYCGHFKDFHCISPRDRFWFLSH